MTHQTPPDPAGPVLVLYTMGGCPFCVLAKEYLSAAGLRWVEAPVDDPASRKAFKTLSRVLSVLGPTFRAGFSDLVEVVSYDTLHTWT